MPLKPLRGVSITVHLPFSCWEKGSEHLYQSSCLVNDLLHLDLQTSSNGTNLAGWMFQ